jgi:hypothetical protein
MEDASAIELPQWNRPTVTRCPFLRLHSGGGLVAQEAANTVSDGVVLDAPEAPVVEEVVTSSRPWSPWNRSKARRRERSRRRTGFAARWNENDRAAHRARGWEQGHVQAEIGREERRVVPPWGAPDPQQQRSARLMMTAFLAVFAAIALRLTLFT